MKTFKILNHTISFDEGVNDYIEIIQYAQSYKLKFHERYMSKPQKNIASTEDFALYVQELYNNGFAEEYMRLSEELVNLYIKYGIYDMSKEMIQAKNLSSLNAHLQKMKPIIDEIEIFASQVRQGVVDIESKWQNIIDEAVPGHYFNVYSSSYSDILLNDYFNHKEEKRVEKKRQRLYTENASKTINDYLSQIIPLCQEYINQIQNLIYEDIMQSIDNMYKNCAMDLVSKEKISPFYKYTDKSKSSAILDNINKITNKEVIEEQLVNLLQTDSFNPLVHFKILEYITYNDISQYAEIIKFLKLENMIFYFYIEDYSKGEQKNKELNDKCLAILKSVKDTLNMGIISRENGSLNYTDDAFIDSIKFTKIYFECLKNIFGTDNKFINEKEQDMFMTAIKEASKGTNLVYDRIVSRVDYDYLCEFWGKAHKKRNFITNKKEPIHNYSNVPNNSSNGLVKFIIILIVICALLYFIGKDSDDTNTNSLLMPEAWQDSQVVEEQTDTNNYYTIPNTLTTRADGEYNSIRDPFAEYDASSITTID